MAFSAAHGAGVGGGPRRAGLVAALYGAHRARLFSAFRRRVDGGESVQDFFGDWCAFEGRSDVGYYLGAELVYALAENRSPQQLADLNPDEVYGMLAAL